MCRLKSNFRKSSRLAATLVVLLLVACAMLSAGETGSVSGMVLDPQGASVAKDKLKLLNAAGSKVGETVSDQDGNFVLAGVDPGGYQVKAEEPSYVTVMANASVASGQQQQISVQAAQGTTQLSGTVVDASGAVIAGATVMVRSADGSVQRLTQSDSNGSFSISGLSAGNYRLVVSSPGFCNQRNARHHRDHRGTGPVAHLSGCEHREHHRRGAGPGG